MAWTEATKARKQALYEKNIQSLMDNDIRFVEIQNRHCVVYAGDHFAIDFYPTTGSWNSRIYVGVKMIHGKDIESLIQYVKDIEEGRRHVHMRIHKKEE